MSLAIFALVMTMGVAVVGLRGALRAFGLAIAASILLIVGLWWLVGVLTEKKWEATEETKAAHYQLCSDLEDQMWALKKKVKIGSPDVNEQLQRYTDSVDKVSQNDCFTPPTIP